jgi:hypothetical protein
MAYAIVHHFPDGTKERQCTLAGGVPPAGQIFMPLGPR